MAVDLDSQRQHVVTRVYPSFDAPSQIRIVDDHLPIHRNAARFAVPLERPRQYGTVGH
jgi:hypothetical protein